MSAPVLPSTTLMEQRGMGDEVESAVLPVLQERLDVQKRFVESGGAVRLRKLVHEEVVTVDEPLTAEVTEVERVVIGRPVDEAVAVRYEGDTMIVSVVEERLVTVTHKQLVLVEELRLTRRRVVRHTPQDVTLRREEVIAERLDPASAEWKPVDPLTAPSRIDAGNPSAETASVAHAVSKPAVATSQPAAKTSRKIPMKTGAREAMPAKESASAKRPTIKKRVAVKR